MPQTFAFEEPGREEYDAAMQKQQGFSRQEYDKLAEGGTSYGEAMLAKGQGRAMRGMQAQAVSRGASPSAERAAIMAGGQAAVGAAADAGAIRAQEMAAARAQHQQQLQFGTQGAMAQQQMAAQWQQMKAQHELGSRQVELGEDALTMQAIGLGLGAAGSMMGGMMGSGRELKQAVEMSSPSSRQEVENIYSQIAQGREPTTRAGRMEEVYQTGAGAGGMAYEDQPMSPRELEMWKRGRAQDRYDAYVDQQNQAMEEAYLADAVNLAAVGYEPSARSAGWPSEQRLPREPEERFAGFEEPIAVLEGEVPYGQDIYEPGYLEGPTYEELFEEPPKTEKQQKADLEAARVAERLGEGGEMPETPRSRARGRRREAATRETAAATRALGAGGRMPATRSVPVVVQPTAAREPSPESVNVVMIPAMSGAPEMGRRPAAQGHRWVPSERDLKQGVAPVERVYDESPLRGEEVVYGAQPMREPIAVEPVAAEPQAAGPTLKESVGGEAPAANQAMAGLATGLGGGGGGGGGSFDANAAGFIPSPQYSAGWADYDVRVPSGEALKQAVMETVSDEQRAEINRRMQHDPAERAKRLGKKTARERKRWLSGAREIITAGAPQPVVMLQPGMGRLGKRIARSVQEEREDAALREAAVSDIRRWPSEPTRGEIDPGEMARQRELARERAMLEKEAHGMIYGRGLEEGLGSARQRTTFTKRGIHLSPPKYVTPEQMESGPYEVTMTPRMVANPMATAEETHHYVESGEELKQLARELKLHSYEYTPEARAHGAPPGRHMGPMAEEFEAGGELGKSVVTKQPMGDKQAKMLDVPRMAAVNSGLIGSLQKQIDELKKKRGRK